MPAGQYERQIRPRALYGVPLSPRERIVLSALADGLTIPQTAERMGICHQRVELMRFWMYRKLGARNGPHAVALAARQGLLKRVEDC